FIVSKEGTANHLNLVRRNKAVLSTLSGSVLIAMLTNADLDRYKGVRASQGRAPQTIKHELNLVMGSIRYAKRNGFEVPDLVPPPMKIPAGKLRYLSIHEEKRLLNELDPNRVGNGLAPVEEREPKKLKAMQDNY